MGSSLETVAPVLPMRETFRQVPSAVAVVAGWNDRDEFVAMTVGSLQSASLEPPLVTVSYQAGSRRWERLREVGRVGISVLGSDQGEFARQVAGPPTDSNPARQWDLENRAHPRVRGAAAWLDCRLDDVVAVGDHDLGVYRVLGCAANPHVDPLVFVSGAFGTAQGAGGRKLLTRGLRRHVGEWPES